MAKRISTDLEALRFQKRASEEIEKRVAERTAELVRANELLRKEIEERKQAEEALLESEEKFRLLFAKSAYPVFLLEGDTFIDCNETALRLTGCPSKELLVGRSPWELSPEKQPDGRLSIEKAKELVDATLRQGFNHFEWVRNTLAGREVWIEVSLTVIPIRGRQILYTEWRDITDRKRMEEELRRSRDELEARVEVRTEELQNAYEKLLSETKQRQEVEEQLRQSHKMEAIGTLAGGIAHDFNNMLAVIIGNAELALDDVDEQGPRQNLRQILKASKRSRDLVKQILTFSRRNGGQGKVVKMVPLLKETYGLLRASLPSTIRMNLNIRTKADTVLADPSLVQQVVVNLANNAFYAMREAGGTLAISLSSVSLGSDTLPEENMSPGRYVKLTVKDTGTGIAPEVQGRMFEPFFTTKEPGQGTGMGLSVVYGIVKGYNGMVEVESEVGKGSKFTILLPQSDASSTIEEEKEEAPSCSRKEHILFVDDEPTVAEMAKTILERMDWRVTAFTDASEALKAFAGNPDSFDLIITDQTMPDMTGVVLAKEVLAIRKDMPIILCTGDSEAVSQEKAKETGIREFVTKPITKKEMSRAIRRVLEQREAVK